MTSRADQTGRPSGVEILGLGLGATAAFPAAWWLLGRLDDSGAWITDPDFAMHPPQIDRGLAHLIGAGSTVIAVSVLGVVVAHVARGRWRRCVAGVFVPLLMGFGYVGVAGHVVTAPVIGANIGAGLMLLGALPVAVVLIAVVAVSLRACPKPAHQLASSPTATDQSDGGPI